MDFVGKVMSLLFNMLSAAAAAKSLQLCPTLCDPMDCSPPGSSVHGIFQARALDWGAIAFSEICHAAAAAAAAKSLQSCPTLCDPMDCSLPGSSVHGILQARILEWLHAFLQGIFPTQGLNPHLLHVLHW